MITSAKTLKSYRSAFGACVDCAQKQIALRLIRNALNIPEPERPWPVEQLPSLLSHAQEKTKRADEDRAVRNYVAEGLGEW